MKIAFINIYQNKVYRGAETFVYELSKRLSKNHEVKIYTSLDIKDLWQKKYDVVIPTNGRWQAIIVRKIAWLTGAKVVISGQSGMGWDDKVNLLTFPDAFIALSSTALGWAKKFNPFVKSVYIPNGVDLGRFTFKGQILQGRRTILSVGAFTKQKRLDLVIHAVAKLEDVNLVIAGGGGDLKDELEKLGNKLLGSRFKIISVPFEKMPEIYHRANIFTLPSASSESFGNVLVEAMACGLPVVATDDPIRKEIVGESGILVDPTNTDEYAKALQKALDTNWGSKPRDQAKKYDWDIIADQYEKLLKEII